MKLLRTALLFLSAAALLPVCSYAAQATQPTPTQSTRSAKKSDTTNAAPSAQDIADAKAKGLVWVNTSTHVYHKDGSFYGTTKHGKFMTEDEAQKAGYRAAKTGGSKKSKTATTGTSK